MARTRGTVAKPAPSTHSAKQPPAVLQDVTNTKTRVRPARGKGKPQTKSNTVDPPAGSIANTAPRQLAVAKKIGKHAKSTRKPLHAVSHNTRTTPLPSTNSGDAKRTSRRNVHAEPSSSPASSAPSEDIPTQPLQHQRDVASTRSSRLVSSTPAAVEQSMLVLKSFKRRSRQPSMLNMVKQRLESARSSIAPDAALLSSDDESLDLDDFLPDAAGTPLHASGFDAPAPMTSTKRKRVVEADPSDVDLSKVHKLRKLVSQSDIEDEDPSLSFASAQEHLRISVTPEADHLPQSAETDYSINITELAAGSSPVYDSIDRGTPGSVVQQSQVSVSGPPISQRTPPKTRAAKQVVAPSSAALQSLLPKRRKQFASVQPVARFSIDDQQWAAYRSEDSVVSDAEEHSEFVHQKSKSKKVAAQRLKAAKMPRGKRAAAKTYARRRAQEEDAEDDTENASHSTTMTEAAKTEELAAAREEFASIDKWDLEYETLTTEDSSQGWR